MRSSIVQHVLSVLGNICLFDVYDIDLKSIFSMIPELFCNLENQSLKIFL